MKLKCDGCKVKKCDARDVIKKFKDPHLTEIIERNCTSSYEPIITIVQLDKQKRILGSVAELISKIIKDERERLI